MRKVRLETATWMHPEYGQCVVVYRWRETELLGKKLWQLEPLAVHFDLFTPPGVQEEMLAELHGSTRTVEESDQPPW